MMVEGFCNCPDRECVVCEPPPGMVAALDPGDKREWEWDGRTWEQMGELNGQACERPVQQPPGPMNVSVIYAEQVRTTITGTWIEPPRPAASSSSATRKTAGWTSTFASAGVHAGCVVASLCRCGRAGPAVGRPRRRGAAETRARSAPRRSP